MAEQANQNQNSKIILGLVLVPLGIILLFYDRRKAPLGLIFIALGGYFVFSGIQKKKEKK